MAKQKKQTELEEMRMRALGAEQDFWFASEQCWTNCLVLDDLIDRLDALKVTEKHQEVYRIKSTLKLIRASLCQIHIDAMTSLED